MGDPESALSLTAACRERVFLSRCFSLGGAGTVCKNNHFDITGTPARAPPPQALIAKQQPRVSTVSTHCQWWH